MADLTLKRAEAAEQCINRIQDDSPVDMTLQARDFDKLRNAVGARPDVRRNNWGYRNRYSSPHQCSSISRLVDAGFMAVIGSSNDMVYCKVTEAGCDAIGLTQEQKQRALEDG